MRLRSFCRRQKAVPPLLTAVRSGSSMGQAEGNDVVKGDSIHPRGCFIVLLLSVTSLTPMLEGCRRSSLSENGGVRLLQMLIDKSWTPPDAKERARLAMKQYREGTLSVEPTLVVASLSSSEGWDEVELGLVVCDANEDLRGVILREESVDSNGVKTVLTEHYPFYAHWIGPGVVNLHLVEIGLRDNGQRKDENAWAAYLAMDFPAAMQEALDTGNLKVDPDAMVPWDDPLWDARLRFWRETLPPIWVSNPDPNGTKVWVQVCDQEGHKSNTVELVGLSR